MSQGAEKHRVLVTGATGLLGRSVVEAFAKDPEWHVKGVGLSRAEGDTVKLDLLDFEAVTELVRSYRPDVIVHAAAERRLPVCEQDPEGTRRLNVETTRHLARCSKQFKSWLLFISTDYIFDGTSPPYAESALPRPLNEYGRQKRDAAMAAREADWGCGELRVPLLYGPVERVDESGLSKILQLIVDRRTPAALCDWQIRCPTLVDDIALALVQLAHHKMDHCGLSGAFHWSGPETMTKYQMAQRMAAKFGLDMSHIAAEVDRNDPRVPRDATLDVETARLMGVSQQTKFEEGIECLRPWIDKLQKEVAGRE